MEIVLCMVGDKCLLQTSSRKQTPPSAARSSWKVNFHNNLTKQKQDFTLRAVFFRFVLMLRPLSYCIQTVLEKGLQEILLPPSFHRKDRTPSGIVRLQAQATRHRRKPKPAHNCTLHTLMQAKRENGTLTVIHLVRGTSPTERKNRIQFGTSNRTISGPRPQRKMTNLSSDIPQQGHTHRANSSASSTTTAADPNGQGPTQARPSAVPRPRSILRQSSIASSSSSGRTTPRKNVSINPRISGRMIDNLSDIGPDNVKKLWYTDADRFQLARDVATNIRYMRAAHQQGLSRSSSNDEEQDDEEEYCSRGLEHMLTSRTLSEQSRSKNASIAAVLTEQRLQLARSLLARSSPQAGTARTAPRVCPATLAHVASAASRKHREAALTKAAEDAAGARRYLRREVGRDVLDRSIQITGAAAAAAAPASARAPAAASPSSNSNQQAYLNAKRRLSLPQVTGASSSHSPSLGVALSLREQSRRSKFLQQFANRVAHMGSSTDTGTASMANTTGTTSSQHHPMHQSSGRGQPLIKRQRRRSDGFISAGAASLMAALVTDSESSATTTSAAAVTTSTAATPATAAASATTTTRTTTTTPAPTTGSLDDDLSSFHIGGGYVSS